MHLKAIIEQFKKKSRNKNTKRKKKLFKLNMDEKINGAYMEMVITNGKK